MTDARSLRLWLIAGLATTYTLVWWAIAPVSPAPAPPAASQARAPASAPVFVAWPGSAVPPQPAVVPPQPSIAVPAQPRAVVKRKARRRIRTRSS